MKKNDRIVNKSFKCFVWIGSSSSSGCLFETFNIEDYIKLLLLKNTLMYLWSNDLNHWIKEVSTYIYIYIFKIWIYYFY